MQKVNKDFVIDITLWILLLSTTFVVCPRLWNPTETGKYFYLALFVGAAFPVAAFRFLATRSAFRISLTDIALFCFVFWIFARSALGGLRTGINLWFLMLLPPLYVIVRATLMRSITNATEHSTASVAEHIRPLLWVIVSVTTIEAIWGFLQLHGLLKSYNGLFAISGSFFNPGPYSAFLACGAPLALYFIFKGRNRAEKILGIVCIVFSVIILPATLSRAAWMAVLAGCLFFVFSFWIASCFVPRSSQGRHNKINLTLTIGGVFLVALFFAGAYLLKKESADGRMFVWHTSMALVRENPLTGSGFGSFQPLYCSAQADYFLAGKATEEELMIANVPEYAFNEYLQITVEHGIIGLLLFLFVIYSFFARRKTCNSSLSQVDWRRPNAVSLRELRGGTTRQIRKRNWIASLLAMTGKQNMASGGDSNSIKFAVQGSLIAFLVFAFFSYPFSIPALTVLFVVLAAISASLSPPIDRFSRRWIGSTVLIVCLGLTVYAGIRIFSQYTAYREWKSSQMYYNTKDWEKAEEKYSSLYHRLNQQKHFLFEYALCLSETGQYDASNDLFFRFLYFGSDPMVYNCMGNNYKSMGDYEKAENMYFLAFHTVPNRHYPLYLLMQLYVDNGLPEKAKAMAEILLEKPVKVESTAIEEMLEEARRILEAIDNL